MSVMRKLSVPTGRLSHAWASVAGFAARRRPFRFEVRDPMPGGCHSGPLIGLWLGPRDWRADIATIRGCAQRFMPENDGSHIVQRSRSRQCSRCPLCCTRWLTPQSQKPASHWTVRKRRSWLRRPAQAAWTWLSLHGTAVEQAGVPRSAGAGSGHEERRLARKARSRPHLRGSAVRARAIEFAHVDAERDQERWHLLIRREAEIDSFQLACQGKR